MSASREEWIAKLAGASGYAAIFDLAAQALSSREEWGDDLRSSQAAARKWAGFFFPVEAIESGATIAGRVAPRAEILAAGEAAAKAVAIELLAPLPATGPHGAALGQEARLAQWSQVSSRAETAAKSALSGNKACQGIAPHHVFGFESLFADSKIEWEEAAHVKSWDEVRAKLHKPWEACFSSDCAESGREALSAQWAHALDDPGQLSGLLQESGASFALAGPAGGLSAARKGASVLRESYRDLSRLSGLSTETIGLGVEGLGLNMDGRGHTAYFNPNLNLMAFGHVPTHVGHEWTHLLDARVGQVGTPEQRAALAALKKAPLQISADPELVAERRQAMLKEQRVSMGYFLRDKAKDEVAKAHLVFPSGPEGEPSCDDAFWESARAAVAKGSNPWKAFLHTHHDANKPALVKDGITWVFEQMHEGYGLNPKANMVCDFVREAQIQDGKGYAKKGYFVSDKEMIARIAESSFGAQGSIPSLAWERPKDWQTNPRGSEAEKLSKAYKSLLVACAAAPEALAGPRSKGTSAFRSTPAPEPVAASLNFNAWRGKREALPVGSASGLKKSPAL